MMDWTGRFEALRDLIIACARWQTWVDSVNSAVLSARVTWPVRSALLSDYPYVNLSPGTFRSQSQAGIDTGSVFLPQGEIWLRLWDSDASPENPRASFETFDGNVSTLLREMSDLWQSGPLIVRGIDGDEPVIVHSHDNAFMLGEDPAVSEPFWCFSARIRWGFTD